MSLVLTRKVDQGVRVYDDTGRYVCRVVVTATKPGRVSLAIDSDPRFTVLRDELVTAPTQVPPAQSAGLAESDQ